MQLTQKNIQKLIYAGFRLVDFTVVERGVLYAAIDNESIVHFGALVYKKRKWMRASNYTYNTQAESMLDLIAAQHDTSYLVSAAVKLLIKK